MVKDTVVDIEKVKEEKVKSLQNNATCATCAISPNTENTVKPPPFLSFCVSGATEQMAQVVPLQKRKKTEETPLFLVVWVGGGKGRSCRKWRKLEKRDFRKSLLKLV